ncbi:Smr/MutS family protein [Commensalibacter sp. M0357]|nr:Smr/MutS family protein [Commensalibacter sp. M0357]
MAIGQKQPGLDKNTWKKFQNGELKSQWRLDLHGFTAHHAFLSLENFILNAYRQQIRCIEIITGVGNLSQGGGILKRELPHWLNRPYIHSMILATSYVSATNNGAVRILLKKRR